MPKEHIGDISNLISKPPSKSGSKSGTVPQKPPSRIEALEGRVASLESALKTVVKELTARRSDVKGLSDAKEKATPKTEAKPPSEATQTPPTAKATVKRDGKPTVTEKPTPKEKPTRKLIQPLDNPEILKAIEACRPKRLQLLCDEQEITKAGGAEALGLDASLVGRTLSYMIRQPFCGSASL